MRGCSKLAALLCDEMMTALATQVALGPLGRDSFLKLGSSHIHDFRNSVNFVFFGSVIEIEYVTLLLSHY